MANRIWASGRILLAATLSAYTIVSLPPCVMAEDTSQAETDAKHAFLGEVNANAVYVRCRPSEEGPYATMKLNRGDKVTVLGIKGTWLKIMPPDGSFAYVPKSFVIMRLDGTIGRMNREWIAKAGSQLNDLVVQPLATVHDGEDVQIIGQHNEYFKIKPPKDSYFWINKQFVDPVQVIPKPDDQPKATPQDQSPAAPPDSGEQSAPREQKEVVSQDQTDRGPTSRPAEQVAESSNTQSPATQPAAFDAVGEYDKLEEQFKDLNNKPILEQPLAEMMASYEKVLASDDLPPSMRRIAELRVATLKARNDAREQFLAVRKQNEQTAQKQQALAAEKQEIEVRIKENDLQIFTALGTLRTSSLQVGQGTLYRLTDPATGRTVAYIRTNDSVKFGGFLGQFIGVRGPVSSEHQLKSVIQNPSEVQPIDPSKVNTSVAAQFIPPSMVKMGIVPSSSGTPQPEAKTDSPPPNNSGEASTHDERQ